MKRSDIPVLTAISDMENACRVLGADSTVLGYISDFLLITNSSCVDASKVSVVLFDAYRQNVRRSVRRTAIKHVCRALKFG
jgi:hypothetical protein